MSEDQANDRFTYRYHCFPQIQGTEINRNKLLKSIKIDKIQHRYLSIIFFPQSPNVKRPSTIMGSDHKIFNTENVRCISKDGKPEATVIR